ncbi:thioredoxin-like protein [Exidia glandulosa HHB12029]|uniref:Thioredoxin-like protein n=1 Tax=Exidia glandulosa HHB12029 TaxID=1314781 RepID=A0A165QU44_EXIGL|nr:thioredoxin-like protein [Exidia glandulosa HHB12029]
MAEHMDEDDDDALFERLEKELDDDFERSGIRERMMDDMKRQMERVRDMRESNHGRYTEIFDEKEVIQTSAKENLCVIHFYHRDFQRCRIMDKHLEAIAPKYFSTRFIRVCVENVPWLVDKLQVQVLPCVACFVGGVLKHRLIGFEELGNDDSFTTASLEMKLSLLGVTEKPGTSKQEQKKKKKRGRRGDDSDESDGSEDDD